MEPATLREQEINTVMQIFTGGGCVLCVYERGVEGTRLSAPARDVTALTTPGPPQWPFSEGADAPGPLTAPLSPRDRVHSPRT